VIKISTDKIGAMIGGQVQTRRTCRQKSSRV